jgi:hypothetical protein
MKRILLAGAIAVAAGCAERSPTVSSTPAEQLKQPAPGELEIVRLVGRHQTIIVTSGPQGPLYSANAADGRMIVARATIDELRENHPEVYWAIERSVTVDEASASR